MSRKKTKLSWVRHPRIQPSRKYQTCVIPNAVATVYRTETKTWVGEICLPETTETKTFYSEWAAKTYCEEELLNFLGYSRGTTSRNQPSPPPPPMTASDLWQQACEAAAERRKEKTNGVY